MKKEEFEKLSLEDKQEFLFYNLPPEGQEELLEIMQENIVSKKRILNDIRGLINILGGMLGGYRR